MISLGKINRLKVIRRANFGLYLDGDSDGEILLPKRYAPPETAIGSYLDVLIYLDENEKLIATTEKPLAMVGDFAWLEVAWVNEYGAFLKWGPMKDLFCPFAEQKRRMMIGNHYIVYVDVDKESYRLVASAKVEKYLRKPTPSSPVPYKHGDKVALLFWQKTPLGFKVIIDNKYGGLVYKNQIYRTVHSGDRTRGFINRVRDDGKIDVTLQRTGRAATTDFSDTLLSWLKNNGGHCALNDKSDANDIIEMFHVSKKTFKRAVGDLYKRRLIILNDQGLILL